MPLFGSSQESKNREQFELAAKRIFLAPEKLRWAASRSRASLEWAASRSRDSVVVEWKSESWKAWWSGGIVAASQAVNTVPSIKQAWGKGGPKEALSLAQLFTLPMVLRWVRWGRATKKRPFESRLLTWESGLRAVTHLFEIPLLEPPALLDEYMNISMQFDESEDHRDKTDGTRGGLLEARYLMSRALTLCGKPPEFGFELLDVNLPVDSEMEFDSLGGKLGRLDFNEVFALDMIVTRTATTMVGRADSKGS